MPSFSIAAGLVLAGTASATFLGVGYNMLPPPLEMEPQPGLGKRATGQGTFQQLIDHRNPSLGTFSQRFWYSTEFYAGPGSPVVLFTPGEIAAAPYTGYLTNRTVAGLFAKAIGGANILLEHRYWGESSPFDTLTTKNLQYLTLENSILDTTYFANNVVLPFDLNSTSTASKAPWVFTGGSYSGALSAWTNAKAPGTFWAYHASSAVVEAVDDFWRYFEPARQGMPANCSADVARVVEYVDKVLKTGTEDAKKRLKARFGLEDIEHDDDFASALANGPGNWQGHDFTTNYSGIYQFCDYVENQWPGSKAPTPGPDGVGLCKAVRGYAKWTKEVLLPYYCINLGYSKTANDTSCFDTYNASSPFYTDLSVDNEINRQWNWFLCNEPFKYWQDGAPDDHPTIVSRLVKPSYWERQCGLFFPTSPDGYTYGIKRGKTVEDVNAYTGGWDYVNTTRLVWTNGQWDPWKDATVSADNRPGGPLQSTEEHPVNLIEGGIHCSDLLARNGWANEGVQKVIDDEVAVVKKWVGEFWTEKGLPDPRGRH